MKTSFYKLIKQPFFGRFMIRWVNPLSSEERLEWKSFSVKSTTQGILQGLFRVSKGAARGTIVLGHPMGKEAKGYFLKNGYADLYSASELNVVVFDFNGFGESTHGSLSYFEDILAVGNFASKKFPQGPLFYHGISLGAQWSVITFTLDHPFDFAIIESAPTTLAEFWKRYPIPYAVLKFVNLIMPRYEKKIRMIERIRDIKRIQSLLLIYSATDEFTPVTMGERFKKISPIPAELWTVPQAEHAKIVKSEHRKQYEEKLTSFVKTSIDRFKSKV